MDVNTPSDPLRNDNEEEHEQHNIQDHEAIPEQRNNEANLIKNMNLNKTIRKLKYMMQKKEKMYISQIQELQRKLNNYRKFCQRLKKRLESPNSKRQIQDK